jgi:chemotaxis protein CheD
MTRLPAGAEIVVGVGECRIAEFGKASPALCLSTYALGSCIAVVAYDWKARLGGLLHVMLPDSSLDKFRADSHPYVYVDTGVPELFRRLQQSGSSKFGIRCCVAGGASMMADSSYFEIGKRNYLALKKSFWKLGIFIDKEDVGGSESRSVRLDLATGRVDLRKGCGEEKILAPAGINLIARSASDASAGR